MFVRSTITNTDDKIVHIVKDARNAAESDLNAASEKTTRNRMLMPSSAGTIAADVAAKSTPLLSEINRNAMTMVEGSVPTMPPILVPNFSAMTVISMTMNAERTNGRTV